LLFAITLLFPPTVFSQTQSASTEELAQRSEVVAVGTVTSLTSEWNENRSSIRTRVNLSVSEFLKGATSNNTLTLFIPGGEVDGVGEIYSDMPRFRTDENVFVFAKKDARGYYRVAGGSQGKYSIHRDEISGKRLIAGDTSLDDLIATVRNALRVQNLK
jgi:hypothetical protein